MQHSLALLALVLANAEARRGGSKSDSHAVPLTTKRFTQWGYPQGWGMDILPMEGLVSYSDAQVVSKNVNRSKIIEKDGHSSKLERSQSQSWLWGGLLNMDDVKCALENIE